MFMWMICPIFMCGSHKSGEHNEIHKNLPHLSMGRNIDGRFDPVVQIQLNALRYRHDELAAYLNHNSPLPQFPDLSKIYPQHFHKVADIEYNIIKLANRCPKCRKLMIEGGLMDENFKINQEVLEFSRVRPVPVSGEMLEMQETCLPPKLSADGKESFEYQDYKPLIYKLAKRFSVQYGFEFDEAVSEGNLAFAEAIIVFDPDKSSFCTHLFWTVKKRLWKMVRHQTRNRNFQELSYDMESGDDIFQQTCFRKAIDELTEDSVEVIRTVLETPIQIIWKIRRDMKKDESVTGTITRKKLTKYFREVQGWKFKRIWDSFEEIKNVLQTI